MKKLFFLLLVIFVALPVFSQAVSERINWSLDNSDPVAVYEDKFFYDGKAVELGPHSIIIDGTISDEDAAKSPYIFNSFMTAMKEGLTEGTEENPMMVYIAPNVYWMHDPEQESTQEAYGITINCPYLSFIGLTKDPYNVVIAANFGHDEGFMGSNWTMFRIIGDGLTLKNITIGNYCNVDLVYPLDSSKNHAKRTDNITQAQLIHYKYDENGKNVNCDKAYAENVNFISRLNLAPMAIQKGMRALYVNCHFESTDDALNSYGVYLNCDFEFYGTKPFGGANGATLLGCTFKSVLYNFIANPNQFMTKGAGVMTLVDCNFVDEYTSPVTYSWMESPSDTFRSYYSNVTRNGEQITMAIDKPWTSVDITNTEFIKAYKLTDANGNIVYNIWNLLRGNEGWDPLNQKEIIEAIGDYNNIPTVLSAKASGYSVESGTDSVQLSYEVQRFAYLSYEGDFKVTWSVSEEDSKYVKITQNENGTEATLEGTNDEEDTVTVMVTAKASTGQECALEITVSPRLLEAPAFVEQPSVKQNDDGTVEVSYKLDLGTRADYSDVTWYVSDSPDGSNPIMVSVTRTDSPKLTYKLTPADIGKYVIAVVEPKHVRSFVGEGVSAITAEPINTEGIEVSSSFVTDFSDFPVVGQTEVIPGYWSVDGYRPLDAMDDTIFKNYGTPIAESWSYAAGDGKDGTVGYYGIYVNSRGARLRYTPLEGEYGDMDVVVNVATGKRAGQGFGSASQYMDFMIKYDTQSLTGYGLRIVRSSGDSCDFILMKYTNGLSEEISEHVRSSAFVTECTIHIWTENSQLKASVETTNPQAAVTAESKGYAEKVELVANIETNTFGGFSVQHTGTTGANTALLYGLEINWK